MALAARAGGVLGGIAFDSNPLGATVQLIANTPGAIVEEPLELPHRSIGVVGVFRIARAVVEG
jgi:hypothetical protein